MRSVARAAVAVLLRVLLTIAVVALLMLVAGGLSPIHGDLPPAAEVVEAAHP